MQLPKSLNAWSEILSQFPHEIGLTIAGLAQKLNRIVGAIERTEQIGHAIPDGYEGITRKGSYERLLISEWLLAEEMPDEFTRRISMQEHLFTQQKLLNKRSAFTTIVLFDTGPFQLGSPRIIQLALLIVLARRAESADCQFKWGILQEPKKGFNHSIDQHRVMAFLNARSSHRVTQQLTDEWMEALSLEDQLEDCWVIGNDSLLSLFPDYSQVWIEELWSDKTREVGVHVKQAGKQKTLVLEMPADRLCARLLRDPYELSVIPDYIKSSTIANNSDIIFNLNGRRLAYRTVDGRIVCFAIPNSPKGNVLTPKYYTLPVGQSLLAVSLRKRAISVLSFADKTLCFHRFPGNEQQNIHRDTAQRMAIDNSDHQLRQFQIIRDGMNHYDIYVLDDKAQVRLVNSRPNEPLITTIEEYVVGFGGIKNGLFYVVFHKNQKQMDIYIIVNQHAPVRHAHSVESTSLRGISAYNTANWSKESIALLIAQTSQFTWLLIVENKIHYLTVEKNQTVIGAATIYRDGNSLIALMMIKNSKEIVAKLLDQTEISILISPIEIINATVNPMRSEIVYINKRKELMVYSLDRSLEVMRILPGDDL